ncbi:MAG: NADPH-dependent FMN reductase [Chloroflexota bacterium]
MQTKIHALAIAGSLREGSYNRALLRAAQELCPDTLEINIYEGLGEIPLYNEDLRAQGEPPPVKRLKEAIRQADALIIATPEYNFSVPGVLKNAIDWASRPPDDSPLDQKPLAIMGASIGNFGTIRAQTHLRLMCVYTNMLPVNQPEVLVARAQEKFDAAGRLTDETSRDFVRQLLEALVSWTMRLSAGA